MSRFRWVSLAGLLICCGLIAGAAWLQLVLALEPCPLCMLQRVLVVVLTLLFLLALIHNPQGWGRRLYALLGTLVSTAGVVVAGRHVWLQHLPPEKVPACGPGLEFILQAFPFSDAVAMIFKGSGECAEVVWRFLGLSIPEWTLLAFIGFLIGGLLLTCCPGSIEAE
ncbi:MAG: disulfide bond formation protein B [Gammaproteobacteria bacterium]|nr:disulfide bond formation protein B [Gammaproteobacteria bacterium]